MQYLKTIFCPCIIVCRVQLLEILSNYYYKIGTQPFFPLRRPNKSRRAYSAVTTWIFHLRTFLSGHEGSSAASHQLQPLWLKNTSHCRLEFKGLPQLSQFGSKQPQDP